MVGVCLHQPGKLLRSWLAALLHLQFPISEGGLVEEVIKRRFVWLVHDRLPGSGLGAVLAVERKKGSPVLAWLAIEGFVELFGLEIGRGAGHRSIFGARLLLGDIVLEL